MRRTLLLAILCFLGGFGMSNAEETKPCLIFTGASETKHVLDLEEFNRITFGEHSMTVTHSDHPENQIELLYSAFHRFEVGDGIATDIIEIPNEGSVEILYNKPEQTLQLTGDGDSVYSTGIFSLNGTLVCRTNLRYGESVSLESLEPGVYIAIAVNGDDIRKIKFVK